MKKSKEEVIELAKRMQGRIDLVSLELQEQGDELVYFDVGLKASSWGKVRAVVKELQEMGFQSIRSGVTVTPRNERHADRRLNWIKAVMNNYAPASSGGTAARCAPAGGDDGE